MKFGSSGYGMEIGSWLLWVFLQLSLKLSLPVFQKHCLLLFPDRSAENTGSKSADLSLPPVKGSQVSSISLSLWVLYYLYVALFQSALSNKTKPIAPCIFYPSPPLQASLGLLVKDHTFGDSMQRGLQHACSQGNLLPQSWSSAFPLKFKIEVATFRNVGLSTGQVATSSTPLPALLGTSQGSRSCEQGGGKSHSSEPPSSSSLPHRSQISMWNTLVHVGAIVCSDSVPLVKCCFWVDGAALV